MKNLSKADLRNVKGGHFNFTWKGSGIVPQNAVIDLRKESKHIRVTDYTL